MRANKLSKTSKLKVLESSALPSLWILEIALLAILGPSTFISKGNFTNLLGSQAILFLVALALIVPMTAGDYDLSVGAVVSLGAMITAVLTAEGHVPLLLAMVVAIIAGVLIGFVNGALVVLMGIDPFIITLGSGTAVTGVVYAISGEATISGVPGSLTHWVYGFTIAGIPLDFYYAIFVMLALWWILSHSYYGERLLFTGQSREVARLGGVRVGRMRWQALVFSAFLSAVAGVIYAGVLGAGDPSSGSEAFLLPAFAAAFLGSTTIKPGRFNPLGTGIAIYFLGTGVNGLELAGFQTYVQDLFYGIALVGAVVAANVLRKKRQ